MPVRAVGGSADFRTSESLEYKSEALRFRHVNKGTFSSFQGCRLLGYEVCYDRNVASFQISLKTPVQVMIAFLQGLSIVCILYSGM